MSLDQNVPDGTFVKEIADLVHPDSKKYDAYRQQLIVVGDKVHAYDDPSMPEPKTLKVSTLGAVVAYIKAKLADEQVVVNVTSPTSVQVVAPIVGDQRQQFVYLTANATLPEIILERNLNTEQFLIQLQSCFLAAGDSAKLLKFAGQLKLGLRAEITDDGITQEVTTAAGITGFEKAKVSNPWILSPFRTFPEIEQPSSPFILRLTQRKIGDALSAEAALYLADGGAWRAEAINRIGAWLAASLPEGITILA